MVKGDASFNCDEKNDGSLDRTTVTKYISHNINCNWCDLRIGSEVQR
jgi:hypothetical protein